MTWQATIELDSDTEPKVISTGSWRRCYMHTVERIISEARHQFMLFPEDPERTTDELTYALVEINEVYRERAAYVEAFSTTYRVRRVRKK